MANTDKDQQDFCKGTLESIQELIGRMDLKAGIVLTVVGFLTTALFAIFPMLIDKAPHIVNNNPLLILLVIFYFFLVALILIKTMQVFIARPPALKSHLQAPRMLFPLLILNAFQNDKDYAERAMKLTHNDIIADYANQIMECSNIYKHKHEHVNNSIKVLRTLLWLWLLLMVIGAFQIFIGANAPHA